ncbi:MAG: hypothetical protein ACYCT9_12695 [Leptospirillum sp.]
MEEIKEETIKVSKKTNRFRALLGMMGRISKRISLSNLRRPDDPWVRIRERKGSKTLVWGMGDGKTFGEVPLGPGYRFSGEEACVKIKTGAAGEVDGRTVLIGSPGNEAGNVLLSRKIEKALKNQGRRALIVWAGGFILVFLILLEVLGGTALGRLASLSQSSSGGDSLPSVTDIPSSMSSGLTCHSH